MPTLDSLLPRRGYAVEFVRFHVAREGAPPPRTLNSPQAVAELMRRLLPDDAKEHFYVLLLDARKNLVAVHEVSMGSLVASVVHPREVFAPAIRVPGVDGIILVHNHPSGNPEPSQTDLELTRRLVEAGELLDLPVFDHVVIGDGTQDYVSLAGRGKKGESDVYAI